MAKYLIKASYNSEGTKGLLKDGGTKRREAATAAGTEPTRSGPVFVPATDIYETANGLVLFAEIPGTDPGSISVTLDRQVLRLSARTQMAARSSAWIWLV